jgi:hypothetical protein
MVVPECTVAIYSSCVRGRSDRGKSGSGNILTWVTDTFRSRGFMGALRHYLPAISEFVLDLTPTRRKSRFGDIGYDIDHGVDTTWANVSLATRIRELLSEGQYQPTEPGLFHEILDSVPADMSGFTFIDLGSGKGRTLLMASGYPFGRIAGVELLQELNEVAIQNVARYRSEEQKCFNIESFAGDARDFVFPSEPTVLYLFNPFPEHVLRAVLSNLRQSLPVAPREVYVIYHNLIFEQVFAEQQWLEPLQRTHQFAVYRAGQGKARGDSSPSRHNRPPIRT